MRARRRRRRARERERAGAVGSLPLARTHHPPVGTATDTPRSRLRRPETTQYTNKNVPRSCVRAVPQATRVGGNIGLRSESATLAIGGSALLVGTGASGQGAYPYVTWPYQKARTFCQLSVSDWQQYQIVPSSTSLISTWHGWVITQPGIAHSARACSISQAPSPIT